MKEPWNVRDSLFLVSPDPPDVTTKGKYHEITLVEEDTGWLCFTSCPECKVSRYSLKTNNTKYEAFRSEESYKVAWKERHKDHIRRIIIDHLFSVREVEALKTILNIVRKMQ